MRILFFGTRLHGMQTLLALAEAGHEIAAVTTWDYGMDDVDSTAFEDIANKVGAEFILDQNLEKDELVERYAGMKADLGVCVGWRRLVGPKLIQTTAHGFIGPHAADLPKYRGFASSVYSILLGEEECGFCIMRFKPGVPDNGDILSRFYIPIKPETSIRDLMETSRPLLIEHILTVVEDLEKGQLNSSPQDESKVILSYPRLPRDGEIDWDHSAEDIDRLVRAVTRPYPGAFTYFQGHKLYIWKAGVHDKPFNWVGTPGHVVHLDGQIGVLTGNGILILKECQYDGEQEILSPAQLFPTHRLRLGMDYAEEILEMKKRILELEKRVTRNKG